jgi:dihydrofolate reductase
MRRVRYNVATSLDGFIASPDGSTNWIVEDPNIDFDALYAEFDTFVMGRKTYEVLLKFGNPLAGRPKDAVVVVSTQMKAEDHTEITIITGKEVLSNVKILKEQPGRDIWLMGGSRLVTPLLEAGLVDTIEAGVMPVVIGQGIPMVDGLKTRGEVGCKLRLEDVRRLEGSGILLLKYAVLAEDELPHSS